MLQFDVKSHTIIYRSSQLQVCGIYESKAHVLDELSSEIISFSQSGDCRPKTSTARATSAIVRLVAYQNMVFVCESRKGITLFHDFFILS
jgi:hypothetical protein